MRLGRDGWRGRRALAVTAVVPPTIIGALLAVLAVPRPRRVLISYLSAGVPFSIGWERSWCPSWAVLSSLAGTGWQTD